MRSSSGRSAPHPRCHDDASADDARQLALILGCRRLSCLSLCIVRENRLKTQHARTNADALRTKGRHSDSCNISCPNTRPDETGCHRRDRSCLTVRGQPRRRHGQRHNFVRVVAADGSRFCHGRADRRVREGADRVLDQRVRARADRVLVQHLSELADRVWAVHHRGGCR